MGALRFHISVKKTKGSNAQKAMLLTLNVAHYQSSYKELPLEGTCYDRHDQSQRLHLTSGLSRTKAMLGLCSVNDIGAQIEIHDSQKCHSRKPKSLSWIKVEEITNVVGHLNG